MSPQQKEDLRHAVLEFLTARHPTAHTPRAIRRHVAKEVDSDPSEADVEGTALFLVQLGHAQTVPDPLGSTKYFSATPAGVLARERGFNQQTHTTKE